MTSALMARVSVVVEKVGTTGEMSDVPASCRGTPKRQIQLTAMVWELFQDLISGFHTLFMLLELVLLLQGVEEVNDEAAVSTANGSP